MKVFVAIAVLFALAAARPPVLGPPPFIIIPGDVYEFESNGALVQLILNINPAAFPVPSGVADAPSTVDPVIVAPEPIIVAEPEIPDVPGPVVPGIVVPEPVVIPEPVVVPETVVPEPVQVAPIVIPEPVLIDTPEIPVVIPEAVINVPEILN